MEVGEGAGWVCGVPTGERGKNEKREERGKRKEEGREKRG